MSRDGTAGGLGRAGLCMLLALALLWGAAGHAAAAAEDGAGAARTLSLKDAMELALAHNPMMKAAQARLAEAQAGAAATRAEARGRVDAETTGSRFYLPASRMREFTPPGQPAPTDGVTGQRLTGAVTWTGSLWTSPQRLAADLGADARRAGALKEWQDALARTIQGTGEAYLALLQAQEAQAVAAQRAAWAEEALRVVEQRFRQGQATRVDLLEAESEWHAARTGVEEARRGRELAEKQLLLWLGEPLDGAVAAVDPVESGDPVIRDLLDDMAAFTAGGQGADGIDTGQALQVALARRWDVQAAEAQVLAARAGLHLVETGGRVNLGLMGTYQWQDAEARVELDRWGHGRIRVEGGKQWMDRRPTSQRQEDEWQLGLQLSWTLWDGQRQARREEEARAQVEAAEASVQQLVPGLTLEVEAALYEMHRAQWAEEVARIRLEAAEENLRQVERLYGMAAATEADLLGARTRREAAHLEWKAAQWQRVKAQLTFAVATGWRPAGFGQLP